MGTVDGIEPPSDVICLLVCSAVELHRSLFIIVGREALVVLLIPVHLPRVDTTHPAVSSLGVSLTVILTRSYRTVSKNFRLSAYRLLLISAAAHRWVVRQFRIVPTESSSCQGTLLWWWERQVRPCNRWPVRVARFYYTLSVGGLSPLFTPFCNPFGSGSLLTLGIAHS